MDNKFFDFGDMRLMYGCEDGKAVMTVVPRGMEDKIVNDKMAGVKPDGARRIESALQIAIEDNFYSREFTAGKTHRNKESCRAFGIPQFRYTTDSGIARLEVSYRSEHGLDAVQTYEAQGDCVRTYLEITNRSTAPVTLENAPSFNLCKLSPFVLYNDRADLLIHTMRSNWSGEARLTSVSPAFYGLEDSWCGDGIRVEKFGQCGSMPANGHLPWVCVEDRTHDCSWAVAFETPSSWQIEIASVYDGLSVSGGQADYVTGHWKKRLESGDVYRTDAAYFAVVRGGMEAASQRLVKVWSQIGTQLPSEASLPIIYNEYCYSWGNPSMETVRRMLPVCKRAGCEYFVVDAGWYCPDGKMWWSLGDWVVNPRLFPDGLKGYVDLCRSYGMRAGIWFEFESVSDDSTVAQEHPDWLLTCHGTAIRHGCRHMLDFRKPEVRDYLRDKVIMPLAKADIGYIKVDYNETIGLGVDGAESIGEGLREHTRAVLDFYQELKETVPDLVLEICSSGGMRHEPKWIGTGSMSSFSDAHEGPEGAVIACHLHRFIPPRKLQIWAVIRGDYDADDTMFTMAKSMLGRVCLSGDLSTEREESVLRAVTDGTKFYEQIKHIVADGETIKIESRNIPYLREIHGTQVLQRKSDNGEELLWYGFAIGLPSETIEDEVPCGYQLVGVYGNAEIKLKGTRISAKTANARVAGCVAHLKKQSE